MKLEKFLTLTTSELEIKKNLLAALALKNSSTESEQKTDLKNLILKLDTATIIKLAICEPAIQHLCKNPIFNGHWENLWRQCGMNPSELAHINKKPIRELTPIPTISCFDLLKGFFIYQGYRKLIKENPMSEIIFLQAKEYLEYSASFGCFQALNVLCMEGLKILETQKDITIAQSVLFNGMQAARLHWTPGYFLLSNIYREFILHKDLFSEKNSSFTHTTLALQAFISVLIAHKLESYSASMLNNAYQGKSLQEASGDKFTNWFITKNSLSQSLSATEIRIAYREADTEFNKLATQYKLTALQSDKKTAKKHTY